MRWAVVLLVLTSACDGDSGEKQATSEGSTTIVATSSTSSTSSTASAESSSGGGPTYMLPVPTCRRECDFAADCCPAGLEGCPSPDYPGNYGCEGGLCVPATCVDDAQCDAVTSGSVCKALHGIPQCVVLCDVGGDSCSALGGGFGCGGATDAGNSYCYERCDLGPPCPLDTCNPDGVCVCASTDECVSNFRCDIDE